MNSEPISESMPSSGKRQFCSDMLQSREAPHLCFVLQSHAHGPARGYIGGVKREGVQAVDDPAVMAHQVDLQETWLLLVPFAESAQRDLMLEQRARPGVRPPFELILLSLPAQQAIDGRRAHPAQLLDDFKIGRAHV